MFRRFRALAPNVASNHAALEHAGRRPGEGETVNFVGYATDCRMRGALELGHARLSDLLDGKPDLRLDAVALESLEDGHLLELETLDLHSDELCAVVASGPRGERLRRRRTLQVPVWLDIGPYHVRGDLHALPGADPLGWLARRPGFAALTNVHVHFVENGEARDDSVEALLVNPAHITFARVGG